MLGVSWGRSWRHPRVGRLSGALVLGVLLAWGVGSTPTRAADDAAGGGTPSDKSGFNLFDPTPRPLMRGLSSDRPGITESPYTVDAGHYQIELGLVDFIRNRDGPDFDRYRFLPVNLKAGLTHEIDLQLILQPYTREELRGPGDDSVFDGFGNTTVRLKINLLGNDGGPVALAAMPYLTFGTADQDFGDTDHLQGGLILPIAVALPQGFRLGAMAEFDIVRDSADEGYGLEFLHTVTLSHAIAGDLGGYVEYAGVSPADTGGGYLAFAGAGLTYLPNQDTQLDLGVNFGLSHEADDFEIYGGVTFRL